MHHTPVSQSDSAVDLSTSRAWRVKDLWPPHVWACPSPVGGDGDPGNGAVTVAGTLTWSAVLCAKLLTTGARGSLPRALGGVAS